jgi:hypothetical protein
MEFTALANHRKVIRAELAAYAEQFRTLQVAVLKRVLDEQGIDSEAFPPAALAVLMVSISQVLVMEEALGVTMGHAEMRALVARSLARFRTAPPARGRPAARRESRGRRGNRPTKSPR